MRQNDTFDQRTTARLTRRGFALAASGIAAGLVMMSVSRAVPEDAPRDPGARQRFAETAPPLVQQFCSDCHSGAKAAAGLDLSQMGDASAVVSQRDAWEKVVLRLRSEEMPPADQDQPSDQQRRAWITAIDDLLSRVGPGQRDPGRVTLHRLNRTEYNNTIHDLLGIDLRPADDFPHDDVGYGFDNIGDVLSMPPPLLEKYVAAANRIAIETIALPGPPPVISHLTRKQLRDKTHPKKKFPTGPVPLLSEGDIEGETDVKREADYQIRVRAHGDQAGNEPVKMEVRVDDRLLRTFDVTVDGQSPEEYAADVHLPAGKHLVSVGFVNDFYDPKNPDSSQRDRNLFVHHVDVCGPLGYQPDSLPASHRRIIYREPSTEKPLVDAAEFLTKYVQRAYRRPAAAAEIERLTALVKLALDQGDSFEQGMRLAVAATLVSPRFLFRLEEDPAGSPADSIRALDDFELASRLSYFLWSSMPDDELLAIAAEGRLRRGDTLDQQLARMLRDPKSQALVENFAGQWLQLRMLKAVAPDAGRFPAFDDGLRAAMIRETELFFAGIVRENRSVLELLDADYTYVNERLARHYGLADVRGNEFRRVALSGDERGGLLGQAGILTLTSNPTRTSPVKRGLWVLSNLLGTPPPPPPADAPPLENQADQAVHGTLRQRLEQHREKAACAVCHERMDPLGFGLENYDAIGAWRTTDSDSPIDAAGTLPGGRAFNGPRELKALLKARPAAFARCLTEKLLTYALGRGMEYDDHATQDDIVAALIADDYRFESLLRGIVHSDAFQKRRVIAAQSP